MLYFLVHDADFFHGRLTPALAASWRRRDFAPLAGLAAELAATLDAFAERFRLTAAEQPLVRRAGELRFDRRLWRHLAGELLLYAAADAPDLLASPDVLDCLLGPDESIRQAHTGSRDLTFGAAVYRPGRAGLNDAADVARLADALAAFDPEQWTIAALHDLLGCDDDADRADELALARERFVQLCKLYGGARVCGQVVVCEEV